MKKYNYSLQLLAVTMGDKTRGGDSLTQDTTVPTPGFKWSWDFSFVGNWGSTGERPRGAETLSAMNENKPWLPGSKSVLS